MQRTQQRIVALGRNRQFQVKKRKYEVALRGIHVACLLIMFLNGRLAMPYPRRDNVRHATLIFRALERWAVKMCSSEQEERLVRMKLNVNLQLMAVMISVAIGCGCETKGNGGNF